MGGLLFAQGMGFGLAVAAPVGPMAVLCMRRSLAQGWRPGLATGAGIAVGDALYACVAVAGLAGFPTSCWRTSGRCTSRPGCSCSISA